MKLNVTNPTVLVLDDDDAVRDAMRKVLDQAGYRVIAAANGHEASARFNLEEVGLVLLGLNLPFKHGLEILSQLTHLEPETPIIVITGQPDPNPTALLAGVSALMEKPVDGDLLLKTVGDLLAEAGERHPPQACRCNSGIWHQPAVGRTSTAVATQFPFR